jgi:hypothetical protein
MKRLFQVLSGWLIVEFSTFLIQYPSTNSQ